MVEVMIQNQAAAMARRESKMNAQRERARRNFEGQIHCLTATSTAQQQTLEENLKAEQARVAATHVADRVRYETVRLIAEARIDALNKSAQESQEYAEDLAAALQMPINERQSKVDFVNGLSLPIRPTELQLLVGLKGTGKSTFLWLLQRGAKPKPSFTDGTVDILQLNGFVDSIGLLAWTPEELWKLLVLLIYDGFPKT